MRPIIFTTHALERAQKRIWPTETFARIEGLLLDAWRRGPAKLAQRAGRTYWVTSEPTAVLVTINEKGISICKTVLNSEQDAQNDADQHEARLPPEEPTRAVCRVVLEVTYDRRHSSKHDEIREKLEHLVSKPMPSQLITKQYKVISYKTSSTVEVVLSSAEADPKGTG